MAPGTFPEGTARRLAQSGIATGYVPEIDSLHVEIRAWDVSMRVALGADPAGTVSCPMLGVSWRLR